MADAVQGRALVVFNPEWENDLLPQVVDRMRVVAVDAAGLARQFAPVERGDVAASIKATVDPDDGSMCLYADHWDAPFSEFGAGPSGAATQNARGAGDFPGGSPFNYGPDGGRPATPFIRPAALAAVKKHFG